MQIIVAEGIDKSGKRTQTDLLTEHLKKQGYKVVKSEFHRYDTPTGKLIQQWLKGEWEVDDHTIEYIMAADKQAQQQWITSLEERGVDFLVLDRYLASQICFQKAKGLDERYIYNLHRYMRRPDLEILFDISPEESMRRKGQHGENDRYESDHALLSEVRKVYLEYFKNSARKVVLKSIDSLSVDEVAEKVNQQVSAYLYLLQAN